MRIASVLLVALLSCVGWACSGGGGNTSSNTIAGWEKFRHDPNNTGLAGGAVATNNGHKQSVQIDGGAAPSPISSSPAIATDGASVYVATEGGTLAALPRTLGSPRWKVTACSACPQGQQALGGLISSPAAYFLTNQAWDPLNNQTTVFVGSNNGSVFAFQDAGNAQVSCTGCFQPNFGPGASVKFLSSPNFTTDPIVATVNGVFIGARIDLPNGTSIGKLYALNRNGTLNWEFPRPGDPNIGAVTSSAALGGSPTATGTGNTWYFTAADNYLYALAGDGALKWKAPIIGTVVDPTVPFAISPLTTASFVLGATADGSIFAINQDGSPFWRSMPGSTGFAGSLAVGGLAAVTVTPVPAATPTPQPAVTGTVTPTPTLVPQSFVYGITKSGEVIAINITMPTPTVIPVPIPIAPPVLSSPAISSDGYVVFGTADGTLHAVNTLTGLEPSGWPVKLTNGAAIRSSPSIADDGVIYVGADDGMLYAVGLP